ncbi:twin-arginine translocase TatA/TatE family subunit [Gordonibacter massiliensis (ex Traore et al. 2017)]|uniref:Sec-independent protein translocase protein TatA n=1 Tax=Gordonibacter massiliensis (ex Traore et al. 2017) TaxID=1841863 RepID=A0A842JJG3_9ACTN|nr:twin-arginine translocase TatA/TatE family subunit [Gordonibacter massiliensis (ex Traore et al. 2017)]MBC2889240.1 twin-arginine translocase TatA/TatE family subunit [Gordonibacter massiliensis (ex Traore et al. 2017)]
MKILGMGMPELLIILGVILLIFGPKNLPKLGSALGSTVKNLREGLGGDKKIKDPEEDAEIVESEEVAEDEEEGDEPKSTKKVRARKAA